ncbi:MAG: enoyl-CoA hydratase [Algoriphagus sp.]|jgi:enoyl-CoA hydratase
MNFKTIKISIEEKVAVLTLSRPKALNALNQTLMKELYQFFSVDVKTLDLTGIIITGDGDKAFVAGADITEFLDIKEGESFGPEMGHQIFNAIENCHLPVIAAVNGYALGGGCELAMACHLRVASSKALFGTPEVTLGLIPGYGGTQRLTQLVGKGKALELMMTADMIGAEEALKLGLANHVVEAGTEITKSKEILSKIAKKAPLAISKVIESVNAFFEMGKDGYQTEIDSFKFLSTTSDFREGATAFIEKRKANFQSK